MQFIADTSHHIMSSLSQLTCTNSIHRQKVYQFAHNFNLSHALCQDVYYIILRVVILRVNKCHKKREKILNEQLLSFFSVELPFVIVIQSPFTLVIYYIMFSEFFDILQQIVAFLFI